MFVPQHTSWSTISYLSLVHGVIADVHDRPWVCLGGSVQVGGTQEDGARVTARLTRCKTR